MKFHILSVWDSAAAVFGMPNFVPTIGSAVRSFGDEVQREARDNVLNQHPEDFMLYKLGTYDDNTGLFDTGVPDLVSRGVDFAVARRQAELSFPASNNGVDRNAQK